MGKKNKEEKQEVVGKKSAPQAVAQNLRSSQKIKKAGKKTVGQNLLAVRVSAPLMTANSATFHGPIIYDYDSVNQILSFDSIGDTSGTINVPNNTSLKTGLSLDIDSSSIEVTGSIGQVTALPVADSPDINYSYIYLKTDTTTGKKVFLGLGTNSSSPPSGWNIKIAHDEFAGAFLGANLSGSTTAATQNFVFSPNIGTITNLIISGEDQQGNQIILTIGNPTVH